MVRKTPTTVVYKKYIDNFSSDRILFTRFKCPTLSDRKNMVIYINYHKWVNKSHNTISQKTLSPEHRKWIKKIQLSGLFHPLSKSMWLKVNEKWAARIHTTAYLHQWPRLGNRLPPSGKIRQKSVLWWCSARDEPRSQRESLPSNCLWAAQVKNTAECWENAKSLLLKTYWSH